MTNPLAPGNALQTPNLGLVRVPDDADSWGDEYRAALDALDAHPGVATVVALPETPWVGQIVFHEDGWIGWNGTEWEALAKGQAEPEPESLVNRFAYQEVASESVPLYVGSAPAGSLESDPVWSLRRLAYGLGPSGEPVLTGVTTAVGSWTNREAVL